MAKIKTKIEKIDDFYIIDKDENYEFFFSMSILFYQKLITIMQNSEGVVLSMNPKFESLLKKINLKNEIIKINKDDLNIMIEWIDCLCLIMLDIDSIDLKNKEIKKYLRISESIITTGKKLINT
jgi:hypothetical protein